VPLQPGEANEKVVLELKVGLYKCVLFYTHLFCYQMQHGSRTNSYYYKLNPVDPQLQTTPVFNP
jgi:hypothetical protein